MIGILSHRQSLHGYKDVRTSSQLENMAESATIQLPEFKLEEIPPSSTWVIVGQPGSGKCLGRGTSVMMFDGTVKTVENVVVGDRLMGDDSTVRTVSSVCSGVEKLYRIRQESKYATDYVVNESHILSLKAIHPRRLSSSSEGVDITYLYNRELVTKRFNSSDDALTYLFNSMRYGVDYVEVDTMDISIKEYIQLSHETKQLYRGYIPDKIQFTTARSPILNMPLLERQHLCTTHSINPDFVESMYSKDSILSCYRSIGFRAYIDEYGVIHSDRDTLVDITVEPLDEGEYFGFEIDGNRRFLLGDFTVTHNTTLIENLAYYLKHRYPVARIFTGTPEGYKDMCRIFHPLYVSNIYSEDKEKMHISRQKKCVEQNGSKYIGNYAINVIDDATDNPAVFKTPTFLGLFKIGSRHWAQLFIIGTQYAIDLPPAVRKSVSYVALFFEPEMKERKKLYENFGGLAGSYENFCTLMDKVTGDYTCLVFKKRTQSYNIEDNVSWFRTKVLDKWQFGCKEYRDWGDTRYNKNFDVSATM